MPTLLENDPLKTATLITIIISQDLDGDAADAEVDKSGLKSTQSVTTLHLDISGTIIPD